MVAVGCPLVTTLAVAWSSDPSLAIGLAAALVVGAWERREKLEMTLWVLVAIAAVTISIVRNAYIPPVAHTEGILALAWSHSRYLGAAAVMSLILFTASPLLMRARSAGIATRSGLTALAVLFGITVMFGFTQGWPVPLVGFGAGPILGAALALATASTYSRAQG